MRCMLCGGEVDEHLELVTDVVITDDMIIEGVNNRSGRCRRCDATTCRIEPAFGMMRWDETGYWFRQELVDNVLTFSYEPNTARQTNDTSGL